MSDHHRYRYSITVQSDDLAVINCLRSLADFSQKDGNKRIAWGGTTDAAWQRNNRSVTFRFSNPSFRDGFLREVQRLLPSELWRIIGTSDNDPARPQAR